VKKDLHVDAHGRARMVDVGRKRVTRRQARASGFLAMNSAAFEALSHGRLAKGDALAVARLAGIQGAKRASEWVPLCHPLALDAVRVDVVLESRSRRARVEAEVSLSGRTGAEIEALCAVAAACMALYDMVKALDRGATIREIALEEKAGGRSGRWLRGKMGR
jgi:cyclic pyranopterin monophosphate synthase